MKTVSAILLCLLPVSTAAPSYSAMRNRLITGDLHIEGNFFSLQTVSDHGNLCDHEGYIKNNVSRDKTD